jgi:hypothetical protein
MVKVGFPLDVRAPFDEDFDVPVGFHVPKGELSGPMSYKTQRDSLEIIENVPITFQDESDIRIQVQR